MAIKSVHLSLASRNTNVCRVIVTDDSGLNIRVNVNARSLLFFSRSDVSSTLFSKGLFRSNWPTEPQSLINISHN